MHPARSVRLLVVSAALVAPSAARAEAGTRAHETPIVVRVDERGIAWGDALVGAVAGIGATLVTVGGVALARPRLSASLDSREEP